MSGKPGFWTKDRIELLKKLWGDGLTGPQIATEMGAKSRNAVIGAVHRYGLQGRKGDRKPPAARPIEARKGRLTAFIAPTGYGGRKGRPDPSAKPKEPAALFAGGFAALRQGPKTAPSPPPPPEAKPGKGVSLFDLYDEKVRPLNKCHWPINEPSRGGEYLFCGSPTWNGCAYCEAHARRSLTEDGWKRTMATRRGRAA